MGLHKKKGRRHITQRTAWNGASQLGDYNGGECKDDALEGQACNDRDIKGTWWDDVK